MTAPAVAAGFPAGTRPPRVLEVGAGTGATAGKLLGPRCATKTGLGNAGISTQEGLLVAALAFREVRRTGQPSEARVPVPTEAQTTSP